WSSDKLIIDPLDTDRHWAISSEAYDIDRFALDHTGNHVAFVDSETLWVARVDDSTDVVAEFEHGLGSPHFIAFVDERHIVIVEGKGKLKLIDWQAGQVVASSKLEHTWGVDEVAFHGNGPSGGVLGYASGAKDDPIRVLPIDNGQL